MRYLGNKSRLLGFIEEVIDKYEIDGESFADLFAGTGSVSDYFKNRYKIIANDYMYYSSVICFAKLQNDIRPDFREFIKKHNITPFEFLNSKEYFPQENYFVYNNLSPKGNRMYLTEENAIRIDGIRIDIEEFYESGEISESEYYYLLASLIESIPRYSNTSGTYQAFFKFWESRALKTFILSPLELNEVNSYSLNHEVFNENTNELVRRMKGDIAYIDPPYTITQYTNSYHLLETVARYDYPELFGKTGRRVKRELSNYSNKSKAIVEFEDLFRQLEFKHILLSYSNQSIVSVDEMVKLCRQFAVNGEVYVETNDFREYATNNKSYKGKDEPLKEIIIYFEKDRTLTKSPLNYSGSKDVLLPKIRRELPKHIGTFVDAMGGAFNVGANIFALDKVVYNEYNQYVFEIIEMIMKSDRVDLIEDVRKVVKKFGLKKKSKPEYLKLREFYNNIDASSLNLFVLQMYSFQNMIRMNRSQKMNTPVGNNELNEGTISRILNFQVKSPKIELSNKDFNNIEIDLFPDKTVFYFDPPYFVTKAEYNDGKRGLEGWNAEHETKLLNFLLEINRRGHRFILSNVLEHRGRKHNLLIEWVKQHGFKVIHIGETGIKYPRKEVLIVNYEYQKID